MRWRDQGRKAIDAAGLGIEIDKVPRLAGVLAHPGQAEVLDHVRGKALLVLDFHRVKHAAVGIDADEIRVIRREIDHKLFSDDAR